MDEKQSSLGSMGPAPMPGADKSEQKETVQSASIADSGYQTSQTELPSLKDIPVKDDEEGKEDFVSSQPVEAAVVSQQSVSPLPQEFASVQKKQAEEESSVVSPSSTVAEQASTSPLNNEESRDDVPAPPEQDISIRTMSSDMDALKEGGGVPTEPEKFRPTELHNNEEKIFEPHITETPVSKEQDPERKEHFIKIIVGVGAFIVVGALVGYFLIVPLLKPHEVPETEVSIPQQEQEPPMIEPSTPVFQHTSFFDVSRPADLQGTVVVSNVNLGEIKGALNVLVEGNQTNDVIQEVTFLQGESSMSAHDFLSVMLPTIDRSMIVSMFKNDFTGFVYYDENGAWSGYIFELSDEASRDDVAQMFENTNNLENFFVIPPRTAQVEFKNGSILEESRYKTYPTKGSSFNYGWHGNYVIVSTSYSGFKAIAPFVR
ncbi:MAG: hypothetical protein V1652_00530 [bacterium]